MSEDDVHDSAPGWDAIDRVLQPLYGDQEPLHWAPTLHYGAGGSDPLDGISVYRRPAPLPHWHFVTYGFSELYDKESDDPKVSGFGFELTFRLRCENFDEPPPNWTFSFLQNLARYVFSSGNAFAPGHYMNLNGPIALDSDTQIRAIALIVDRELSGIETPHGHVDFLQVVGITLDELSAAKAWDTMRFLEVAVPFLPLWITDLGRSSLTGNKEVAELIEAGIRRDGSSTAFLFVGAASWEIEHGLLRSDRLMVTLGANGVRDFKVVLPGRLLHVRTFTVASKTGAITFAPSDRCDWAVKADNQITIHLTTAAAEELARVVNPKEGDYTFRLFPKLTVHVAKSEIKNAQGEVVEVIG